MSNTMGKRNVAVSGCLLKLIKILLERDIGSFAQKKMTWMHRGSKGWSSVTTISSLKSILAYWLEVENREGSHFWKSSFVVTSIVMKRMAWLATRSTSLILRQEKTSKHSSNWSPVEGVQRSFTIEDIDKRSSWRAQRMLSIRERGKYLEAVMRQMMNIRIPIMTRDTSLR
uniref:Uncharacterized protein n=1 Tax=Opuntia streptacantha TaxID=393608 RepID=A0A7C8ZMW9_OPUST